MAKKGSGDEPSRRAHSIEATDLLVHRSRDTAAKTGQNGRDIAVSTNVGPPNVAYESGNIKVVVEQAGGCHGNGSSLRVVSVAQVACTPNPWSGRKSTAP
jgi:hypothetical protein